ncbi:hypothetical protein DdX_19595 [Ditylenchus destructor]|uniref:Uncharacterized protein n=1 Tax=Ditylenchus destructor TaxID=166010 RepID=A0AAD4MMW3_9BILA|nr:hypothetical protein DdX_19595 [Ditylenchus destructor]
MFASSKVLSIAVFVAVLAGLAWGVPSLPGVSSLPGVPSVAPPAVPSLPTIPPLNVTLPPLPTGVPDAGELEKLIEALVALIQALLSGAVPTGISTAVPSAGVPSA